MVEITNVKVYDLEESVIACRNAMRTEMPEYTEEEFRASLERAKKLVSASANNPHVKCHDNFLTGIRVSFDLKYEQYFTKQAQRYHWFDYVSSSSMMHRLAMMKVDECCNKYVTKSMVDEEQRHIDFYNRVVSEHIEKFTFFTRHGEAIECTDYSDVLYVAFMFCISNCPMGFELFVRVSTNYKQLQTMYWQRKGHKLREDWGAFETFVESLPYAKEFILGAGD